MTSTSDPGDPKIAWIWEKFGTDVKISELDLASVGIGGRSRDPASLIALLIKSIHPNDEIVAIEIQSDESTLLRILLSQHLFRMIPILRAKYGGITSPNTFVEYVELMVPENLGPRERKFPQ